MASKGKAVMTGGNNSAGKGKKRKNRDVLQFFEDAAVEFDGDDDSDVSDDFFDDDDDFLEDYDADPKVRNEPGKFAHLPFLPKEEELSGDELEKMLEERYRSGSGYVRYTDDGYDTKRSVDRSFLIPSVMEPIIWKVKCKVGREKHVVFCLIQKYVDLKVLGTKLQILSAFAVEHIKGFVFVEAQKQSDVTEACNQLADVYVSLVTPVPTNEVGQLLNARRRYNEIKVGTWARVKNGIYKGDLSQVVAVNNERKRATVKLIPRIDLQALTEKYGGGAILKRTKSAVPTARLISSSELEEFRPLMQLRRDRDTGQHVEFLDGLMLKDGFLYKKVSIDSLAFWDVNPSEDELQKFTVPCPDESDNLEWLSQLYGEQKKKPNVKISKGSGKGEGSSGTDEQFSFDVHDLVLFGKRDFGMITGMEKDENYKILKDGSEGPLTLTLGQKDLKYVSLEKKFTALDHRMKTISVHDTVRILDGPTKGRQGIVKQIYRGIIFLYDENDLDNAYFCSKSQMSEKVKHAGSACLGKDEGGPLTFEDTPPSPKSPLSPKKPWQMRENNADGEQRDRGAMFSVGQALRIRIGPLKGYLCRVVAIRYSDVTVKLDSKQKVLTVKREHLSEVREKSSASMMSDDSGFSSSFKPFDLVGAEGSTSDWLQGTSGSADGWSVGGPSNERGAWPAFPSLDSSVQVGTSATALPGSQDNDTLKESADGAWLSKVNNNQNSSWLAAGNEKSVGNSDQIGAWGTSNGGLGEAAGTGASSSWEKAKGPAVDNGVAWKTSVSSLIEGKTAENCELDSWNKAKSAQGTGSWNAPGACGNIGSSVDKPKAWDSVGQSSESVKQSTHKPSGVVWGETKHSSDPTEDSWGKAAGKWGNKNDSNETNVWKSSPAVSPAQAVVGVEKHIGWGQAQGQNAPDGWKNNSMDETSKKAWAKGTMMDVPKTWGTDKDTEDRGNGVSSGNPWGKAVDKQVGRDTSSKSKEWGSSSESPICDGKGWDKVSGEGAHSQGRSTAAGWGNTGGCNSVGDNSEVKTDSWNKTKSFGADRASSFDKSGGNDSWGQSNSGNDRGFYEGRGSGGRRGRGRDQYGRGRGRERSFAGGHLSSIGEENQDNSFSRNKGWSGNEGGSSWGNSAAGDNQKNTWESGKGWNNNEGDYCNGWNQSGVEKDGGGSSEKISTVGGWNGSSSAPSSWGQKSWEKSADNKISSLSTSQGWKSSTSTQWGPSSEGNATGGWNKGGSSDSSGWKKAGDGELCSDGRGSWSKSAGNGSWVTSGNSEYDEGPGLGRGSSRRGRGGFSRGHGQTGRDGGRSSGRGSFSSWKNDGLGGSSGGNERGDSWSKGWSGGGKGEDKDQTKASVGGSAWGGGSNEPTSSWGKARGWNEKGQDNEKNESSGINSWNSGQGGSSWGNSQSGGGNGEGGPSWGNAESDKGHKIPGEGVSSWGGQGGRSDQKGSWEKARSSNEGQNNESSGNKSWNSGQGGISDQKSSWDKSRSSNEEGQNNKSSGNKSWTSGQGGW